MWPLKIYLCSPTVSYSQETPGIPRWQLLHRALFPSAPHAAKQKSNLLLAECLWEGHQWSCITVTTPWNHSLLLRSRYMWRKQFPYKMYIQTQEVQNIQKQLKTIKSEWKENFAIPVSSASKLLPILKVMGCLLFTTSWLISQSVTLTLHFMGDDLEFGIASFSLLEMVMVI